MSWDAFQRAALAEMGYVLYRPLSAGAATEVQLDDALLARLAKAAGTEPELLREQTDLMNLAAGMHGDAAAKRALWPRLRALRRNVG